MYHSLEWEKSCITAQDRKGMMEYYGLNECIDFWLHTLHNRYSKKDFGPGNERLAEEARILEVGVPSSHGWPYGRSWLDSHWAQ